MQLKNKNLIIGYHIYWDFTS